MNGGGEDESTVLTSMKIPGSYPYMQRGMQNTISSLTVFEGERPPQTCYLDEGRNFFTLCRSEDNDLVLTSKAVSRHHARLCRQGSSWILEDTGSRNGIYKNGRRISADRLNPDDIIRIDNPEHVSSKGVIILPTAEGEEGSWKKIALKENSDFIIGRSDSADLTLKQVSISRQHARIYGREGTFFIQDLHSTNGVLLNGQPLVRTAQLTEKDLITIGKARIIYTEGHLYYSVNISGIEVCARHVVRTVRNGHRKINICNDVSLTIRPGELVAIIGGSGAGKTTFMNAISGYNHPTKGTVLINGQDLYQAGDAFRDLIGYVPQKDIVYDNLNLFEMLDYAARLRLPDDTSADERRKRVMQVISEVELDGKEKTLIRRLSGGQKKRASIAVELLSDPNLFFLDEPASGLDPGTERSLMRTLKNMTQKGKTVILVTHSTLNLQDCDKIIFMGRGGNLCYYGDMDSALKFFGVDNSVDIYNMITEDPDKWKAKYESSQGRKDDIQEGRHPSETPRASRHSSARQTAVLSSRYVKLIVNDRKRLFMIIFLPIVLAALISVVKNENNFAEYGITKSLLFTLACCIFWLGTLNAIQEICKEKNILRREFMTGLHLGSYMLSKSLVLGAVCLIQTVLLVGMFAVMVGMPDKGVVLGALPEVMITCFLTAIASSSMGLLVSAFSGNPDRAMTMVPFLLVPQLLFSGMLFRLEGIPSIISWFVVCRWSMEGLGTTCNLNALQQITKVNGEDLEIEHKAEAFYTYTAGHIFKDWGILLLMTILITAVCIVILRREMKKEN